MRATLNVLLGTIAVGILLVAYGLLRGAPVSAGAAALETSGRGSGLTYQFVRPAAERAAIVEDSAFAVTPVQVRCEPGQRAILRQISGTAFAECVGQAASDGLETRVVPASYITNPVRRISTAQTAGVPRRTGARVEGRSARNWKKTALVVGGSTAAGAGIGALVGGKTGALIGAAIGGGASSFYEANH